MNKKMDRCVKLLGLEFFGGHKSVLLTRLQADLSDSTKTSYIFTPNAEQLVLAEHNLEFRQALAQADLLLPDSIGVVLASRLLSWRDKTLPISERIPGREVAVELLALAQAKNYRVLVLGGHDYTPPHNPNLCWLSGYRDIKHPTSNEEVLVRDKIKSFQPQIILVALGAPNQELWAISHRSFLESQKVKLVMVVGGTFDILWGKLKLAPAWIQAIGLEWLYRLIQEPWRLRRQLKLLSFVKLVFSSLR